ncbi:MAG: hypothetical protein LBF97_03865 [Elusimicrobiota bacterium]|jgi:hypothetical protein|nr:hypothetical protein [Elusimicrobiota bacterium]
MRIKDIQNEVKSKIIILNKILEFEDGNIDEVKDLNKLLILTSFMSSQKKASLFEKFFRSKTNFIKISQKENKGDFKDNDNNFYELKVSLKNEALSINMRQIRLYQDIEYYIILYLDNCKENSFSFKLTKEQMTEEVKLLGGICHGCKKAVENNEVKEFSISLKLNSKNFKRWEDNYFDTNLHNLLWN